MKGSTRVTKGNYSHESGTFPEKEKVEYTHRSGELPEVEEYAHQSGEFPTKEEEAAKRKAARDAAFNTWYWYWHKR